MSPACMPFTDVASECSQECKDSSLWRASEKGVQLMVEGAAEVGPVRPTSQAHAGSLSHDPVGTVSPSSTVETSELSLVLGRSSSHELSLCFCEDVEEFLGVQGRDCLTCRVKGLGWGTVPGWVGSWRHGVQASQW